MRYQNITVSGLPGAGSTTLARNLASKLGWSYVSLGEEMRKRAVEDSKAVKGLLHHDAAAYGEEFDREVDLSTRENLQRGERQVIEGWLAGFFGQGINGVLKVLVKSGEEERVRRIAKRDKVGIGEAKEHMENRVVINIGKWRKMYDEIDFFAEGLYDVVIDTGRVGKKAAVEKVLKELDAS